MLETSLQSFQVKKSNFKTAFLRDDLHSVPFPHLELQSIALGILHFYWFLIMVKYLAHKIGHFNHVFIYLLVHTNYME